MNDSQTVEILARLRELSKRVDRLEKKSRGPLPDSEPRSGRSWNVRAVPLAPGHILGIVAVFCFVLAGSFLVKLAVESGWLTPVRQFALAALLGLTLVGIAVRFQKWDQVYVSLLASAGIIILYTACYGGHSYLGLYHAWFAATLASAVSVFSMLLYRSFKSPLYLLWAVVGSYLVPILVTGLRSEVYGLEDFFLLWDLSFCVIGVLLGQRFLILLAANLALSIYTLAAQGILHGQEVDILVLALAFQTLQFLVFSVSIYWEARRARRGLSTLERWGYFPVLLFYYGIEYFILNRLAPAWAPWVSLGFSAIVFGVYRAIRRTQSVSRGTDGSSMVHGFLAVSLFHSIYLNLLPDRLSPWFAVVLVLGTVPWMRRKGWIREHVLIELGVFLVASIEFFRVLFGYGDASNFEWIALSGSFSATFFALYWTTQRERWAGPEHLIQLSVLCLGSCQALVGLHRLADWFCAALDYPDLSRFAVSASWGGLALALVAYAWRRSDRLLARTALLVFAISACKVLMVDVSAALPIVRIVSLLVLGGTLFSGGLLYGESKAGKFVGCIF